MEIKKMKKTIAALTLGIALTTGLAGCSSDSEVVVQTKAGNITKEDLYTVMKTSIEDVIKKLKENQDEKILDKDLKKQLSTSTA
jgi:foldase protein PrsA